MNSTARAAAALAAGVLLSTGSMAADAACLHRVRNSVHSQWDIASWTNSHCGNGSGTIHLIKPGHSRLAKSIKAYGDHNVLHRPGKKPITMVHRHCYRVVKGMWVKTKWD